MLAFAKELVAGFLATVGALFVAHDACHLKACLLKIHVLGFEFVFNSVLGR